MRKLAFPLLLILGVAAYAGHWFYVARQVPDAIAAWAASARAQGYDVRYGAVSVKGFPLKLDVVVADVAFGGAVKDATWTWAAPSLYALLRPWRFDRILVSLPPAHDLVVIQNDLRYAVAVTQRAGQVALITRDGRLGVLGFDASDFRLVDAAGAAITAAGVKLTAQRGEDDVVMTVGVQLAGVGLPAAPPAFPKEIAGLTVVASLKGDFSPGALRSTLAAWRDGGGTVETERLHLVWGALDVEGDGTLALDGTFRPIGAFHLQVAGYGQAIDAAVALGHLQAAAGHAVRAALDMVAKPAGGGDIRAEVALSLQNGTVYVGPVAVGKIGALPLD